MARTDRAFMQAALHERSTGSTSAALRLIELPRPEPHAGEVRVRLCWSGVNPGDLQGGCDEPVHLPVLAGIVPHNDGAGVIDGIGEGVSPQRLGERVWIWNAAWRRAWGTAAQWVALPSAQAVALPDGVATDAGACLGTPALAAMHAVLQGSGVTGRCVLVTGGAGAVGHYAVQFARLAGAEQVIASVSSALKAGIALDAGAHAAVNYCDEDVVDRVRKLTAGRGVDRIIEVDLAANAQADMALLRRDGEIVALGSSAPEPVLRFAAAQARQLRLRFFDVHALRGSERRRATNQLQAWLERGLIRHHVAARLPLQRIAEAHALLASGLAVGKVLLKID
jgi:NADPH:quinone reductase